MGTGAITSEIVFKKIFLYYVKYLICYIFLYLKYKEYLWLKYYITFFYHNFLFIINYNISVLKYNIILTF